jgi:RNA polymerase sigma-70 factor (ECF subfamily)
MTTVNAPAEAADLQCGVASGARLGFDAPSMEPGPRVAFRAVFDAECGYVWTTLRRLGVAERDVEDVAHETFLRVAAHLHEYDPARPLRAWLFVFALRMARDYRRLARHKHEWVGGTDDAPEEAATPADELLAARETHVLVQRALDALDWDKRVVFVACELEEREVAEVAASLGIPRNTAASRLRLARGEFTGAIRRLALRGRP